MNPLVFVLSAESSLFTNAMTLAMSSVTSFATKIVSVTEQAVGAALRLGMEYENQLASFKVLLGDMEKGKALFEDLQKLAIASPYQTKGLANEASMLMGMGVQGENVVSVIGTLGDVAMGSTEKLHRLSAIYGKVMSQGVIHRLDMNQLSRLGIGVKDLAVTTGKTPGELKADMRANLVPASDLGKMLNRLTGKGENGAPNGRFYEGNREANKTVTGQLSTLEETVERFGSRAAKKFFDGFNVAAGIGSVTNMMAPFEADFNSFMDKVVSLKPEFKEVGTALLDLVSGFNGGSKDFIPSFEQIKQILKDLPTYIRQIGPVIATFIVLPIGIAAAGVAVLLKGTLGLLALLTGGEVSKSFTDLKDMIDPMKFTERWTNLFESMNDVSKKTTSPMDEVANGFKYATQAAEELRKSTLAVKQALEKKVPNQLFSDLGPENEAEIAGRRAKQAADAAALMADQGKQEGELLKGKMQAAAHLYQVATQKEEKKKNSLGAVSRFYWDESLDEKESQAAAKVMDKAINDYQVHQFKGQKVINDAKKAVEALKAYDVKTATSGILGGAMGFAPAAGLMTKIPGEGRLTPPMKIGVDTDARVTAMDSHIRKRLEEGITPFEKFAKKVGIIAEGVRGDPRDPEGTRVANPTQFLREGLFEVYQDLHEKTKKDMNPQLPRAAMAGSAEAQTAVNEGVNKRLDIEQEVLDTIKSQFELDKQHKKVSDKIKDVLEKMYNDKQLPMVFKRLGE